MPMNPPSVPCSNSRNPLFALDDIAHLIPLRIRIA